MNRCRALRALAWFSLAHAIICLLCEIFFQSATLMVTRYHWNVISWPTRIALFVHCDCPWAAGGMVLSILVAVTFFREARGLQAKGLIRCYAGGVLALLMLCILSVIYLILASPISTIAGAGVRFLWDELLPWVIVGPLLGSPLIVRVCVGRFGQRANEDGGPGCHGCGYDLTGNVSGVCPECGRRI
jgi:hypothetical protein